MNSWQEEGLEKVRYLLQSLTEAKDNLEKRVQLLGLLQNLEESFLN